jgi:hypothetical protein
VSIYELLAKAAEEVGAIGKNKRMEAGPAKYDYRSVDDVIAAVHPIFARLGIVMAPNVVHLVFGEMPTRNGGSMRLCTMQVCFSFWAPDGSLVEVTTVGEATDTGDKSANKAHTAALKVALCQLLLIPFDSQDPDDVRHEFSEPVARPATKKAAAAPPEPDVCTECGVVIEKGEKKQGRRGAFKHLDCPEAAAARTDQAAAEAVQDTFEGAVLLDANGNVIDGDPF